MNFSKLAYATCLSKLFQQIASAFQQAVTAVHKKQAISHSFVEEIELIVIILILIKMKRIRGYN